MRVTFDSKAFHAALRAGHGAAVLARAAAAKGIHFHNRDHEQVALDAISVIARESGLGPQGNLFGAVAFDAQPQLVTQANAGIPAFLTNWVDPKVIEVLVSPMRAAEIYGEEKKGDWTTEDVYFETVESTGEVSSYGDFSANGNADYNLNFPQRQCYHYQTFTQWGERELAKAALAKVDAATRKNIASVLVLNKFQNASYFYGIAGLQIYGGLNDPTLYASIASTATWATTTPDVVYEDVRRLFTQVQLQSNGLIKRDMPMVLACSPETDAVLDKTNQYNVNVRDQIKKNFPNLRIETAVEFATTGGELVQLIVENLEGQETATCSFTEKMRAHAVVQDTSSWKQKKSQGTSGFVLFRSYLIGQMIVG